MEAGCISSSTDRFDIDKQNDRLPTESNTSKLKIFASQGIATLAVCVLKFSLGLFTGYTTLIIAELNKENPEITTSIDQLSWFGSYLFTIPVGALIGGLLAQLIGSRLLILGTFVAFAASWLLFYFSSNVMMLLCAQTINGFFSGATKGLAYNYVAEISDSNLRGALMSSIGLSFDLGQSISLFLGNLLGWRSIALVNLSFPLVGFALTCFIPESPYWLANKNRMEEAKLALAWFRGWTTPEAIQAEISSQLENSSSDSSKISNQDLNGINAENLTKYQTFKKLLSPYLQKTFYIPFVSIVYLFITNELSGVHSVIGYLILIFQKLNSPIDEYTSSVIFAVSRFFGSCLSTIIISFTGKRLLLFVGFFGGCAAYVLAAVFSYLSNNNENVPLAYYWIPIISIFLSICLASAGIDKVVFLFNSELYPVQTRQVGAGVGYFLALVFSAVMNKAFLYMVAAIGLSSIFGIYAISNFVGCITTYTVFPETEGKTLKEIEEYYVGEKRDRCEENVKC